LDRVHPLPDGWAWAFDDSVDWYARERRGHTVCVDERGNLVALNNGTQPFEPNARVVLAVILASQGLDSREAMADALQAHVDEDASRLADVGPEDRTTGLVLAARANAAAAIVAMLRRGRVAL
jgi:hypothetical protein